jgi:hypothetical protein
MLHASPTQPKPNCVWSLFALCGVALNVAEMSEPYKSTYALEQKVFCSELKSVRWLANSGLFCIQRQSRGSYSEHSQYENKVKLSFRKKLTGDPHWVVAVLSKCLLTSKGLVLN